MYVFGATLQMRFLDDRPDEQRRGITMKSSAVSVSCGLPPPQSQPYLRPFFLSILPFHLLSSFITL